MDNINFLMPTGFRLEIDRIPGVTFFTQDCSIPVIEMYFAEMNTPMLDYPIPGNKLKYDSFTISFLLDENMKNYAEITKWMYGINNPESLDKNMEYSLMEQYRLMRQGKSTFQNLFSDGMLHILTNNNNENISIQFIDMFPTALSGIKFMTNVDDIQYLKCDASFRFSHFKKIINNQ
jgi:hypothetical protein